MEKVCPICNNLKTEVFKCTKCSGLMMNKGIMQDYIDDYSADMEIKDTDDYCVHIFKCNNCGSFERKNIKKIYI